MHKEAWATHSSSKSHFILTNMEILKLKLLEKGCLSRAPCIGQEGALRSTSSLLLTVSLPLSHILTAGKLQALTHRQYHSSFRQVCESQSVAFCQLLLLRNQPFLPKTVAASPDEPALGFSLKSCSLLNSSPHCMVALWEAGPCCALLVWLVQAPPLPLPLGPLSFTALVLRGLIPGKAVVLLLEWQLLQRLCFCRTAPLQMNGVFTVGKKPAEFGYKTVNLILRKNHPKFLFLTATECL